PQHARQADIIADGARLVEVVGQATTGTFQADLLDASPEQRAIFGLANGLSAGPDQDAAMASERARLVQRHADIQAGLPAQGRQHRVWLFDSENLLNGLGGDRLDVGAIGDLGVGHDRGRVGIDQHDLIALLAECLARLSSRVVEFAGLADHDWPGTYDQDLLDIRTFGHCKLLSPRSSCSRVRARLRGERFYCLHQTCIGPRSPGKSTVRRGPENFPIIALSAPARQGLARSRSSEEYAWSDSTR